MGNCVNNQVLAYSDRLTLANTSIAERFQASLYVLSEMIEKNEQAISIDSQGLDSLIAILDEMLSNQLDAILSHDKFQQLESLWLSVSHLLSTATHCDNTEIDILTIDKQGLADDLSEQSSLNNSGLYRHLYSEEYDTPGGEPYAAVITPFSFTKSKSDIELLRSVSEVCARSHSPFIANIGASFFNKQSIVDIDSLADLEITADSAEYIAWNSLRQSAFAHYLGLCLPKFIIRESYNELNTVRSFQYYSDRNVACWAPSSIAFANNLIKSFHAHGWCVNICGLDSGGKVENMRLSQQHTPFGECKPLPTEAVFSETIELGLSELGLIPLSYYKNSDFSCFFSASSLKEPGTYLDNAETANAAMNTKLPYVFLSSRIAHYLKVIQRENIGSNKTRLTLENELNRWLGTLVTKMSSPSPEQVANYPLKYGKIGVEPISGRPGIYQMSLQIVPHFQVEGVDITLSLVSEIPGEKN